MTTVSLLSVIVLAVAAGPFESPDAPAARGRIDELVFGRLKQLGIQPANLCSDAVFVRRVYLDVIGTLPTGRGGPGIPGRPRPEQAQRADRPPPGARGVRRLLGDEVGRPAAGQVRVPHQPVAQRGAGLSPLDSDRHRARTCPTTGSSASCSPPAAAISACRRSTSTARSRAASRRPSPRRWR